MAEQRSKILNKSITWDKNTLLKLLELYEQHPCLYDTRHKFYFNKHARMDALNGICEGLDISVSIEELKNKINNIRSQVHHEIKKQPSSSMDEGEFCEHVWWFHHAEFLLPYMKSRKETKLEPQNSQMSQEDSDPLKISTSMLFGEDDEVSCSSSFSSCETPSLKRKKNEVFLQEEQPMKTLKKINENRLNDRLIPSKEEEFGCYVAKELSKITDEEILCDAKHEINNIIYKYTKIFLQQSRCSNRDN